jgi:hypothetical protein
VRDNVSLGNATTPSRITQSSTLLVLLLFHCKTWWRAHRVVLVEHHGIDSSSIT